MLNKNTTVGRFVYNPGKYSFEDYPKYTKRLSLAATASNEQVALLELQRLYSVPDLDEKGLIKLMGENVTEQVSNSFAADIVKSVANDNTIYVNKNITKKATNVPLQQHSVAMEYKSERSIPIKGVNMDPMMNQGGIAKNAIQDIIKSQGVQVPATATVGAIKPKSKLKKESDLRKNAGAWKTATSNVASSGEFSADKALEFKNKNVATKFVSTKKRNSKFVQGLSLGEDGKYLPVAGVFCQPEVDGKTVEFAEKEKKAKTRLNAAKKAFGVIEQGDGMEPYLTNVNTHLDEAVRKASPEYRDAIEILNKLTMIAQNPEMQLEVNIPYDDNKFTFNGAIINGKVKTKKQILEEMNANKALVIGFNGLKATILKRVATPKKEAKATGNAQFFTLAYSVDDDAKPMLMNFVDFTYEPDTSKTEYQRFAVAGLNSVKYETEAHNETGMKTIKRFKVSAYAPVYGIKIAQAYDNAVNKELFGLSTTRTRKIGGPSDSAMKGAIDTEDKLRKFIESQAHKATIVVASVGKSFSPDANANANEVNRLMTMIDSYGQNKGEAAKAPVAGAASAPAAAKPTIE